MNDPANMDDDNQHPVSSFFAGLFSCHHPCLPDVVSSFHVLIFLFLLLPILSSAQLLKMFLPVC
jgi:hypothetical protein